MLGVRFRFRVNYARFAQRDFVFQVIGDPLANSLVSRAGRLAAAAVFIGVLDRILALAGGLEYRCHFASPLLFREPIVLGSPD